jgi:ubiquinone/menaquinone biosynthesis C-methylase UbiE
MRVTPLLPLAVFLAGGAWQIAPQRRDPLEYIRILESAERVKKLQVDRVVTKLGIQPGDRVADLGAGSGLFTRPLAREVGPEGIVYAVDIDKDLLGHIEVTALDENLTNIKTVLAAEYDPRIPDKVDLVLICDTLHLIRNPDIYLRDLTRYLRASGRVAVIDYQDYWPQRYEAAKYTVEELDRWLTAAGYRMDQSFDFLEDNFFVVYRLEPLLTE